MSPSKYIALGIFVAALLFWPSHASASCTGSPSCTVKAAGGGNYTTIQACANAAVAGDTCTVYAGTYNEYVNLPTSGTGTNGVCTSCITFTVNPGDTAQV